MRTYAGDTSLPGGKVELEDKTIEDTARREAFEEIGLPPDRNKATLLCILEPFLKALLLCILEPFLAAELIVTPVVVLILDNTLRSILNSDELTSLFSHPLFSFLSSKPPFPSEPDTVEVPYHTSYEAQGTGDVSQTFRVHQFLTGREAGGIKPVFGLTAGILIRIATIDYAREPDFEVRSSNELSMEERMAWALLNRKVFRDACEKGKKDLPYAEKMVKRLERRLEEKEEKRRTRMKTKL